MSRKNPRELLRSSRIVVSPEIYHVISFSHTKWTELVASANAAPRVASAFLVFKDTWEVTLIIDDENFRDLAQGLDGARVEKGFRLVTFDADLDFDVVGFMAEVARILAENGVSILPISSFSRDHVLVRQEDLARALKAFSGIVSEVC